MENGTRKRRAPQSGGSSRSRSGQKNLQRKKVQAKKPKPIKDEDSSVY